MIEQGGLKEIISFFNQLKDAFGKEFDEMQNLYIE